MIYPRGINSGSDPAGKRRKRLSVLGLFCLVVFLTILSWTGLGNRLGGIFDFMISPVFKVKKAVANLSSSISFSSKQELQKDNLRLVESLRQSEALVLDQQKLLDENTKLKETLGRFENKKLLLGAILAKPNRSPYDTVLIDIGLREGLKEGSLALAYGEIPIGRVVEVRSKTSLIRLFSSPGQKEYVEIGENKVPATALGQGGGNFRIILPKGISLAVGDEISLPGIESNIVGSVEKIVESNTETFSHIFFKSKVNIYQLSKVFIIIEE